uniref:Spermatogenesis associated 22 n=1 Tax=Varanus komodoensis TaxID=61221 RepID=A0A8D2L4G4_VARKO
RKRNRQPLTSNPLENDSPTPPLSFFENESGGEGNVFKKQGVVCCSSKVCVYIYLSHSSYFPCRLEEKNASANIWKTKDLLAFGNGRENRKISQPGKSAHCSTETGSTQQKIAGHPKASQSSKAWAAGQKYSTTTQWPAVADTVPRGLQDRGTSYAFKQAPCQQKANERKAAKLQENDNSLRMICAVIESMKHWSQFTHKAPLLFEVLGTLDSAVTPGPYSAKTFLLRDGKETVSCVFYEIDWDLPRLIRGQVHRCVGNYDTKRKVFQCVSVRPATVTEQQTFQDFVKASDVEMSKYVKSSNET